MSTQGNTKLSVRLSARKRLKKGTALQLSVFLRSFNKNVLSTYCVLGTVLSSRRTQEIKQTKPLPSGSINSSTIVRHTESKYMRYWGANFYGEKDV